MKKQDKTPRKLAIQRAHASASAAAPGEVLPAEAEQVGTEPRPVWLTGLSNAEERFCFEYLKTGVGSVAARATWPETQLGKGALKVRAHRLLQREDIRARIRQLHCVDIANRLVTLDQVKAELARLAYVDIRKLYHEDGSLKSIKDLDDDTAAAVAGVDVHDDFIGTAEGNRVLVGQTKKVKLYNKQAALRDLGEMLGGFEAKRPVTQLIVSIKL